MNQPPRAGTPEYQAHQAQQDQQQQMAMAAAQLTSQRNELIAKNRTGFEDLARRGIQFDPGQILNARIDCLIQSISVAFGPAGQLWLLQAFIDWEKFVEGMLADAASQGTQAQLSVGGSFTPGMIRKLAEETNTFGTSKGGLLVPPGH